ncbi:DNA-directed RNA polymerase subunit P [Infirmifilum lucidum]|uniref:DNA-directed RNA polymerase subunit Rpo12 n=1 Tax=Infirmifilum lucidum TaxID=2776706 RepID=A0A7L9FGR5_9CREN|nr:DNA-directed RNA polymerase subunit P [Infirmifilum lucidum]
MSSSEKIYRCIRCGRGFSQDELRILPGLRCPYCGFRVIEKTRPPMPKRVRAV